MGINLPANHFLLRRILESHNALIDKYLDNCQTPSFPKGNLQNGNFSCSYFTDLALWLRDVYISRWCLMDNVVGLVSFINL